MKRLLMSLSACGVAAHALGAQTAKRRVAVLDFDYATVHEWVADLFGSDLTAHRELL